jgi:hypothetical protein
MFDKLDRIMERIFDGLIYVLVVGAFLARAVLVFLAAVFVGFLIFGENAPLGFMFGSVVSLGIGYVLFKLGKRL